MAIVSAQEDERIKAIEYDRMTEQAANNGLIIDTNVQWYDEPAPPSSAALYIPQH